MNRENCSGYALMRVLALIMIILLLLTSLFGMIRFRHQTTLLRIQKEEAHLAAKAAVELMVDHIQNGEYTFIENNLGKTETLLEFESDDGEHVLQIPLVIWIDRVDEELIIKVEAKVGRAKEKFEVTIEWPDEVLIPSDSDAKIATFDNAERDINEK